MNLSRYDTLFESYLINIALTQKQVSNINTKLEETLSLFLAKYDGDIEIFAQGSYSMGTTVRPLTEKQSLSGHAGEYDIDIALERTSWGDAEPTLREMRTLLVDEYDEMVDKKERETCERVHHLIDDDTGVGFHVDYVPIKHTDIRKAAKRSDNKWFPSDTKELLNWFETFRDEYTFLPAAILTIKRMRDYAELTDELPSICITALVCMYYETLDSYADDLLNLLNKIELHFSVPYEQLSITVEPVKDNLAQKITRESHVKLLAFIKTCTKELRLAFEDEDTDKIRQYLSQSFPHNIDEYPVFLEALRNNGRGIELDGSLKIIDINEERGKGKYISKNFRKFFGSGEKLLFRAKEKEKSLFGIRWQVLNSSKSPSGKRRGNLFRARGASGVDGSSSNRFVNHETEEYGGEHWIKYFTYDKGTKKIVEIGRKFYVGVEKQ